MTLISVLLNNIELEDLVLKKKGKYYIIEFFHFEFKKKLYICKKICNLYLGALVISTILYD